MKRIILLFVFLISAGIPARADVTSGLVAWWKLNDAAGNVIADSAPNPSATNGNNGNLGGINGTANWTIGTLPGGSAIPALSFDGATNSVTTWRMTSLEGLGAASWTFWVKLNNINQNQTILSKYVPSDNANQSWEIVTSTQWEPSGSIAFKFVNGQICATNQVLTSNNIWYHVAVVFNPAQGAGTCGELQVYVNGQGAGLPGSNAGGYPLPTSLPASTALVNLGSDSSGGSLMNGSLADVRIYNRALSADEVSTIYSAGTSGDLASYPKGNPAGSPQNIKLATCNESDVANALLTATPGSTISLPAGTCTWTSSLSVTTPLTIQGVASLPGASAAGGSQTVILDEGIVPNTTTPAMQIINLASGPAALTRLTGINIDGGPVSLGIDPYNRAMIGVGVQGTNWRIDNMTFHADRTSTMDVSSSGGVIDHNTFNLDGWHYGIYGFNGGDLFGDASWARPYALGSGTDPFFVEDNTFTEIQPGTYSVALDGWSGERVVFRYNTLNDTMIANHGTDSGGIVRGARSFELYNNTITDSPSDISMPNAIYFRSANGVVFGNTITGTAGNSGNLSGPIEFENYRDFAGWNYGQCNGTSPYDENDGTTDYTGRATSSGTFSGTWETMTDLNANNGKGWTPNQWVGYSVFNQTQGGSSIILSNTANTITALYDNTHANPPLYFNQGDNYTFTRAIVCLDQTGRGAGLLLTRDPSTGMPVSAFWPQQAPEASYIWSNTVNGSLTEAGSASPHVVVGRDIINGTCPANYTPYTYPHPLDTSPQYLPVQPINCPGPSGGTVNFGDVNGDGNVDYHDAVLTAEYLVGLPVPNFNIAAAEVDGNKTVDIPDAYMIAEYVHGFNDVCPKCGTAAN